MRLFNIIIFFIPCFSIITKTTLAFISPLKTEKHFKRQSDIILFDQNQEKQLENYITKTKSFAKLIRYKSIPPTFLLNFSGGWIINPSLYNLLHSEEFIVSCIITLLVMSSSMIINDIHDVEIDKVNNPSRPLVTGQISMTEAYTSSIFLLSASEYLNYQFLPDYLQTIVHLAILSILLYTPILKKITVIKNISCSSLVAFSIFFSGLATENPNSLLILNKNFDIFSITLTLIFLGSLHNELLLDMRDYEGDKANNINTIPVIFGIKNSWVLVNIILYFNLISTSSAITYLYNETYGSCFFILSTPLMYRLFEIKKNNYSKQSIMKAVNSSTGPLFLLLMYLCWIVSIK